eukprot:SAG11_NODE_6842_length_1237_cov_2.188049_1_plen_156_part_00
MGRSRLSIFATIVRSSDTLYRFEPMVLLIGYRSRLYPADDPNVCFASLLHEYIAVIESYPLADDGLFISSTKSAEHNGSFWSLAPASIAKSMGRVMADAGFPPDFLPHSARAAGCHHRKKQGWSDEEILHHANMSARTYVTHYMRQIRRRAQISG